MTTVGVVSRSLPVLMEKSTKIVLAKQEKLCCKDFDDDNCNGFRENIGRLFYYCLKPLVIIKLVY